MDPFNRISKVRKILITWSIRCETRYVRNREIAMGLNEFFN